MIMVLQITGIVAVLVGLLTIVFGIPVKEFSFGNTLILAGTIGLCTGMILLGLSVVARELKLLPRRLAAGPRPAAEPRASRAALPPFPGAAPAAEGGLQAEAPVVPPVTPTPHARREPPLTEPEPTPASPPPLPRPKRNLLFTSNVRKEREGATAVDSAAGDLREPQVSAPPPDAGVAPPASFEDAWPRVDRGRSGEVTSRRSSRLSAQPVETTAEKTAEQATEEQAAPPPVRPEEKQQPAVTVLKSGVVDGMAYSLYSDGSIEAQMPEGMMRFASIDELRSHLDQRPA